MAHDEAQMPRWLRAGAVVVGAAIAAVAVALFAALVLPRWWAALAGTLVGGVGSQGVWWGLAFGALATGAALGLIWLAVRRLHGRGRLIAGIAGGVLLVPNLLTLAITTGATGALREARVEMIIAAPSFRAGTLAGVLIIGAAGVAAWLLMRPRHGRGGRGGRGGTDAAGQ